MNPIQGILSVIIRSALTRTRSISACPVTSLRSTRRGALVVAIVKDPRGFVDHLDVQWFDWEPGTLATEDEETLVLVSSVSEGK